MRRWARRGPSVCALTTSSVNKTRRRLSQTKKERAVLWDCPFYVVYGSSLARSVPQLILVDVSILHHEVDMFQYRDIVERVFRDGDQVCIFADRD